ncbi:hypothetical protein AAHC03_019015 [Spirometra sp. Aus1]
MDQWFHRNPYKATGRPIFDLGPISTTSSARTLCSHAADKRQRLLDMFSDPNLSAETLMESANQYISLLMGFVEAPEVDGPVMSEALSSDTDESDSDGEDKDGEAGGEAPKTSKDKKDKKGKKSVPDPANKTRPSLRRVVRYSWSNSLSRQPTPTSLYDAYFELFGILFNLAQWYSKHAAKVAASSQVSVEEAVDVHKSLRYAAGIFSHLRDNVAPKINVQVPKGSDLDRNVLDAYIKQCLAEAQEVAIARAIEAKHDPGLIAALSYETSVAYEKCKNCLTGIPEELVSTWRAYFNFKACCFRAYAYCFHAEHQLKVDKGGIAVAAAQEALKHCETARRAARAYASGSGAEVAFFRKLQPFATRTLSKAQSENSMIYHQPVPSSLADLNLKATFGIATPEMPGLVFTHDDEWKDAADGFNANKMLEFLTRKDAARKKKEAAKLHFIKEQPIYHGVKDPANASGCVIS